MKRRCAAAWTFGVGILGLGVCQTSQAAALSGLKKCAAIAMPDERLACYDRLAERPTTPTDATLGSTAAPPSAASSSSLAAPSGSATAPLAATAAPTPKVAPVNSFGLYAAEHPVAPSVHAAAQKANVVAIGHSSTGRPTVTLDGDQVWQLDGVDPVLAIGDAVIINRASLGSFNMTTPSGRTHRVVRLH